MPTKVSQSFLANYEENPFWLTAAGSPNVSWSHMVPFFATIEKGLFFLQKTLLAGLESYVKYLDP